jgi:general secretion pathway protein J
VERDGDRQRLTVALTMVLGGQAIAEQPPRAPELLADRMRVVRFHYRGLTADNQLGPWQEQWITPDALPLEVKIDLQDADGRDWPPLVVALPLAGSYGGAQAQ